MRLCEKVFSESQHMDNVYTHLGFLLKTSFNAKGKKCSVNRKTLTLWNWIRRNILLQNWWFSERRLIQYWMCNAANNFLSSFSSAFLSYVARESRLLNRKGIFLFLVFVYQKFILMKIKEVFDIHGVLVESTNWD